MLLRRDGRQLAPGNWRHLNAGPVQPGLDMISAVGALNSPGA